MEGGKAEGKGREVPYFRLTLLATLPLSKVKVKVNLDLYSASS